MTVKIKVLTRAGLNVDNLLNHSKHIDEFDPRGSSRFEAIDDGHSYLADVPISSSVREIIIDKGPTHQLEIEFSPTVKVSTVLGGSSLISDIEKQVINFTGNNGADVFESGRKADILKGLGGNDRLDGNFGNDKMEGGTGNDRLAGDNGSDVLTGGLG
jgi:Ca2+-binding RTX toxin-like protein